MLITSLSTRFLRNTSSILKALLVSKLSIKIFEDDSSASTWLKKLQINFTNSTYHTISTTFHTPKTRFNNSLRLNHIVCTFPATESSSNYETFDHNEMKTTSIPLHQIGIPIAFKNSQHLESKDVRKSQWQRYTKSVMKLRWSMAYSNT